MSASDNGHLKVVKYLIDNGADKNTRSRKGVNFLLVFQVILFDQRVKAERVESLKSFHIFYFSSAFICKIRYKIEKKKN